MSLKNIFIHTVSGGNDGIFDEYVRDDSNKPLVHLKKELRKLGYNLTTSDEKKLTNVEWVLFFDAPSVNRYKGVKGILRYFYSLISGRKIIRDLYKECLENGFEKKVCLFLWEAQAVCPDNWDEGLHNKFPVIITWNDLIVDEKKYFKIYWPQSDFMPKVIDYPFGERKLLVNISMNKFSDYARELYSERRKAIKYFEVKQPDNFDLYGVGWNRPSLMMEKMLPFLTPKYTSYRGTVANKWDVLSKYKFCLCYENIYGEQGWITEKIFDCFKCGCIPIYWGASNITDYVDENAFIDRRKFSSNEELEKYLLGVTAEEFKGFQNAINNYLKSEKFKKFLPQAFAEKIIETLDLRDDPILSGN